MRIEKIGNQTLILADCRDVLDSLPDFDAVVTDPPYGLGKKLARGGVGARIGIICWTEDRNGTINQYVPTS